MHCVLIWLKHLHWTLCTNLLKICTRHCHTRHCVLIWLNSLHWTLCTNLLKKIALSHLTLCTIYTLYRISCTLHHMAWFFPLFINFSNMFGQFLDFFLDRGYCKFWHLGQSLLCIVCTVQYALCNVHRVMYSVLRTPTVSSVGEVDQLYKVYPTLRTP